MLSRPVERKLKRLMLMRIWQINIILLVKEFHYRLFSTNKVMTGNSLNRSLLYLPLKKDLKSKSYTAGHLLLTYQLPAAVLQITLAAGERKEAGYDKSSATNQGPSIQQASAGPWAQHPRHKTPSHIWRSISYSGLVTPTNCILTPNLDFSHTSTQITQEVYDVCSSLTPAAG